MRIRSIRLSEVSLVVVALMLLSRPALAQLTLTNNATGITLTTYVSGFASSPNNPGPLGVAFRPDGKVMVTHWKDAQGDSDVFILPNHNDGQIAPTTPSAIYAGEDNALGLAQIPDGSGGYRYFMTQYYVGRVIEVDQDGAQVVGGLNVSIAGATGIVPYPDPSFAPPGPLTNHLFVSAGNTIWVIDATVASPVPVQLTNQALGADGLAISPDGGTLYVAMASPGTIGAFSTSTGALIASSPFVSNGVDGIALGAGCRTGYLYVNTKYSGVYEVGVPGSGNNQVTLIATGGTRGDFVAGDAYATSPGGLPSLLLTQGDRLMRMTFDDGGVFGPPMGGIAPTGSTGLSLTSDGVLRGFRLTLFASGFTPFANRAPLGIAFRTDGKVLVTQYRNSPIYLLNSHADNQVPPYTVTASYKMAAPDNNALGLAQMPDGNGGYRYFMTQFYEGKVLEIDQNGTFVKSVSDITAATSIVPFPQGVSGPHAGHLFVSNGNTIYEVDPDGAYPSNTTDFVVALSSDGMSFSPDGTVLYAAIADLPSYINGYSLATGQVVWTSPTVNTRLDGIAIGAGSLDGYIYGNSQGGEVWEFGLPAGPTPNSSNLIAKGGSRGDFIATDPDVACCGSAFPSLLLTQTDRIMRLDPPQGGWFGPPVSSNTPVSILNSVPAVGTAGLLLAVLLIASAGFAIIRRRALG